MPDRPKFLVSNPDTKEEREVTQQEWDEQKLESKGFKRTGQQNRTNTDTNIGTGGGGGYRQGASDSPGYRQGEGNR